MAGYYEMKGKLGCWENWHDDVNQGYNDYVLDRKYWMRPVTRCRENALGTTCSFYGPKTVPRTTQESFLQGRGQVNNDHCPDCDVIYLPKKVFELTEDEDKTSCQDMALQPQHTRFPKSCNNLSETEISQYAFLPGAFQKGYQGVDSLCHVGINIQGREQARASYRPGPQTPAQQRTNYGSYNSWATETAYN